VGARASRTHGQRRARGGGSSSRVYPARSGARAHGPAGRSHYSGVGWPGGGALGREGGGGAQVRERDGGAQSSRGGEGREGGEKPRRRRPPADHCAGGSGGSGAAAKGG